MYTMYKNYIICMQICIYIQLACKYQFAYIYKENYSNNIVDKAILKFTITITITILIYLHTRNVIIILII